MEYAAKYETSLEGLVLISSVYTDYKPQNTFAFLKTGLPPKNQIDANKWYMENIDAFLGGYFYNTQAKNIFSNTVTSYSVSAHVGGAKNDISTMVRGLDIPTLILVGTFFIVSRSTTCPFCFTNRIQRGVYNLKSCFKTRTLHIL